jgi:MOSC domain-containing protein YiiM
MCFSTRLASVNVGLPETVSFDGRDVSTGIFKEPVHGPVGVARLGLAGDGQADLSVHGGVDKAVYAYSLVDTAYWRRTLGRDDLGPGTFGENLSLEERSDEDFALGDVLRVGDAVLQVTQPRQPCVKLALKLGLPRFPKQFTRSGRVGFYLRVLEEGTLEAGDRIECVEREDDRLSVRALNAALMLGEGGDSTLRRALDSPALSAAWRRAIEERLARRRDDVA